MLKNSEIVLSVWVVVRREIIIGDYLLDHPRFAVISHPFSQKETALSWGWCFTELVIQLSNLFCLLIWRHCFLFLSLRAAPVAALGMGQAEKERLNRTPKALATSCSAVMALAKPTS